MSVGHCRRQTNIVLMWIITTFLSPPRMGIYSIFHFAQTHPLAVPFVNCEI